MISASCKIPSIVPLAGSIESDRKNLGPSTLYSCSHTICMVPMALSFASKIVYIKFMMLLLLLSNVFVFVGTRVFMLAN